MAEYSNPKRIVWYNDIPCPVCGAERTNSWEKRITRALGYEAIICEDCVAKEYGLTVEQLRKTMMEHFGLVPCPGI